MDKNFAVHLPVLDRLFGTCYLPGDRWPASYGLADGTTVPPGYVRQLVDPFVGVRPRVDPGSDPNSDPDPNLRHRPVLDMTDLEFDVSILRHRVS